MKWVVEPLSKAQNGRTDELSTEIERFGLYAVVHLDNMNSTVFDGDGYIVKEFKNSEVAWQDANRLAQDLFLKSTYSW